MSKTIKVIDLLNKIANGEIPNKVKYKDRIYVWDEEYENYHVEYENWWLHPEYKKLNDTVEIIEEQQDIDIQSIEDIKDIFIENASCGEDVKYLARKYNDLIQAVKQLDKQIKEKE